MIRVAMWSGPRNLSTAMMRSWENRSDTEVLDEPLYAAFLARTGLDHPGAEEIVATGPSTYDAAIATCLAPSTDGAVVSYQKHMAHHLLADVSRGWLDQLVNCLLLRDPRRVLASYTRVRARVTLDDIGLPQQAELVDRCAVVVDADDFLLAPRRYTEAICAAVGAGFDESMLAWPAGPRSSDGVWAPHWYGSVEASTGFGPAPEGPPPAPPAHLATLADDALDIYRDLHRRRLVLA